MKRFLTVVLCLSLVAALGACNNNSGEKAGFNETGMPIMDEAIELEVGVMRAPHIGAFADMPMLQEIEKQTNIKIKWREFPSDSFNEKVNLMLASGDFPDIMWRGLNAQQLATHSRSGDIIPLDDLIDKYAPRWKELFEEFPYAEKIAKNPDGKIYSLPYVRQEEANSGYRDTIFINKAWLDKLGLPIPETTDEFLTTLKAFAEQDPNGNGKKDELPWTFIFNSYVNGNFDIFGSFGRLDGPNHFFVEEGGKVVYAALTEENKNAIKYMHELYKVGGIDPESFTQNATQFKAKVAASPELVGVFTSWNGGENYAKVIDGTYVPMKLPVGPSGEQPIMRYQLNEAERGYFTIFKNNEYPEASMRWANELADGFLGVDAMYGPLKKLDDGRYEIMPVDPEQKVSLQPSNFGPFIMRQEEVAKIIPNEYMQRRIDYYNFYKPYVVSPDAIYPSVFFTEEQQEIQQKYEVDIKEYIKKTHAKWITEGGIDEEWDAFISKLKEMNIDEVIKAYQDAYDSFNK